jgi:hypothetical protein
VLPIKQPDVATRFSKRHVQVITKHIVVDHGRCDRAKSRLMKVVHGARLADWLRRCRIDGLQPRAKR